MNLKQFVPTVVALCTVVGFTSAPMVANAQSRDNDHRQSHRPWKDLGISGDVAVGLLTHNNAVACVGVSGGLYSTVQFDADQQSGDRMQRARATLYHNASFQSQGHTYVRQTVNRGGQQYYKFNRKS